MIFTISNCDIPWFSIPKNLQRKVLLETFDALRALNQRRFSSNEPSGLKVLCGPFSKWFCDIPFNCFHKYIFGERAAKPKAKKLDKNWSLIISYDNVAQFIFKYFLRREDQNNCCKYLLVHIKYLVRMLGETGHVKQLQEPRRDSCAVVENSHSRTTPSGSLSSLCHSSNSVLLGKSPNLSELHFPTHKMEHTSTMALRR